MQRILVVDDAEINRELLKDVLQEEYLVETAVDGEEALLWLEKTFESTAALLLDLNMPRLNGFAVLDEMEKRGWMGLLPVLVISG